MTIEPATDTFGATRRVELGQHEEPPSEESLGGSFRGGCQCIMTGWTSSVVAATRLRGRKNAGIRVTSTRTNATMKVAPNESAESLSICATLLGSVEGEIPERARYSVEFGKPVVLPAKLGVYARRAVAAGDPAWTITARNPRKLGTVHATATLEEL